MKALFALLPCATVILSMLFLRQTGAKAASGGAIVAILLWASGTFTSPAYRQLENAFIDAIILQIIVAAIILPGVIFIEFCKQIGTTAAVAGIIDNLDLNAKLSAIVIATGFGVLIESLTGFGVSLFVTVPLLAIRFKKHQIIGLALIGMCLMPWGALGVAAHLGSELAEIPIRPFSLTIWNISGPVALFLPILCLLFLPDRSFADFRFAICAGCLLSGGIGLGTYLVGVEIAGALGGALVICFIAASVPHKRKPFIVFAERKLAPYYLLIFAVLIQKILVVLLNHLDFTPTISSGRVTFTVLTSPGLSLVFAIFSAAFFLRAEEKKKFQLSLSGVIWRRAWRPLTTIFLFTFGARLVVEISATKALADFISATGPMASLAATALLGALSGFVTGSGIAGNALFMPSAAAMGMNFDSTAVFAAIQHCAAGHTAVAALPVGAILIAALPNCLPGDERNVMQVGLGLSTIILVLLMISGFLFLGKFN